MVSDQDDVEQAHERTWRHHKTGLTESELLCLEKSFLPNISIDSQRLLLADGVLYETAAWGRPGQTAG